MLFCAVYLTLVSFLKSLVHDPNPLSTYRLLTASPSFGERGTGRGRADPFECQLARVPKGRMARAGPAFESRGRLAWLRPLGRELAS